MIIWAHISVLDLFYITYRGPVFMWYENGQWLTLLVHFIIALLTTTLYWLLSKRSKDSFKNKCSSKTSLESDVIANSKITKTKSK